MRVRSALRAQVWEIAGGQCEHPELHYGGTHRCARLAAELAHIVPRGMGHTGYRDTLENVMAACLLHARSTDDLSSGEWLAVEVLAPAVASDLRAVLARYVNDRRRAEGVDLERSDR